MTLLTQCKLHKWDLKSPVTTKIVVFWNVTPYSVTETYWRLRRFCCLRLFLLLFFITSIFPYFPIYTYIYFNFQLHQDIFLPLLSLFLHCPPAHYKRQVRKVPSCFLHLNFYVTPTSLTTALPPHASVFPAHGFTHLLWRWKQHVITKRWYTPTRLHGVIFQKTAIFNLN
jgi:hypothetical protein